jgi:hypothetical protein
MAESAGSVAGDAAKGVLGCCGIIVRFVKACCATFGVWYVAACM